MGGECKWRRCRRSRKAGRDFCQKHLDESIARLFPAHPKCGRMFPLKWKYRRRKT